MCCSYGLQPEKDMDTGNGIYTDNLICYNQQVIRRGAYMSVPALIQYKLHNLRRHKDGGEPAAFSDIQGVQI